MGNLRSYRSGSATAADTAAHQFADVAARHVYLSAPAANTSNVTILGMQPDGVTPDTAGITLVKGGNPVEVWPDNLNELAFKLGTANDTVQYLVGR